MRASKLSSPWIVSTVLFTLVECQYHYQQPSPFHLPSYQGFNQFQQPYVVSSNPANYYNGNIFHNQVQKPGFVSANNNYNYVQSSANSQVQQSSSNINSVPVPAQPTVMKHIYFHIPPPDVEATVTPASTTKKKIIYNIVFIKVPAQKPKYYINSQGFLVNPLLPVEDKTVIYVLSKKPDDYDEQRAKSAPNHEVYYVKYKGNASGAAAQINTQLSEATPAQALLPGLVNGRELTASL